MIFDIFCAFVAFFWSRIRICSHRRLRTIANIDPQVTHIVLSPGDVLNYHVTKCRRTKHTMHITYLNPPVYCSFQLASNGQTPPSALAHFSPLPPSPVAPIEDSLLIFAFSDIRFVLLLIIRDPLEGLGEALESIR